MTGDRSVADVLHDVVRNLQDIVRSEVRLAKAEIRQEATQAVSAGAWLAASVVAAVSAWMCLVWTAVYGLAIYMSIWVATLVVAVPAFFGLTVGFGGTPLFRTVGARQLPEMREKFAVHPPDALLAFRPCAVCSSPPYSRSSCRACWPRTNRSRARQR